MDIGKIINESLASFKKNLLLAVPGIATVFVAMFLSLAVVRSPQNSAVAVLAALLSTIVNFFAHGVTLGMAREVNETGSTTLATGAYVIRRFLAAFFAASAIVSFILISGFLLFILPGLAASFFLMFVFPAIVMEDEGAVGSLGRSYSVVRNNLGDSLVLFGAMAAGSIVLLAATALLNSIPVVGQLAAICLSGAFVGVVSLVMIKAYAELAGKANPDIT